MCPTKFCQVSWIVFWAMYDFTFRNEMCSLRLTAAHFNLNVKLQLLSLPKNMAYA